jgi:hypothetical protein
MAKSAYGDNDNVWTPSDTSTFAQQSQNLAKQAGDAGINQGQIGIEQGTAKAEQAAGQSGQNVAAGSQQVAQGAKVDPTMAQGQRTPPPVSPNGGSQPTIQPQYTVTQAAPDAPNTDISNDVDTSTPQQYNAPDLAYLQKLFPGGVPDSIMNVYNQLNPSANTGSTPDTAGATPATIDPVGLAQYENIINNRLVDQSQQMQQNYSKGMNDLNQSTSQKQQAISDYINQLNQGLKDYTSRTQDLSNMGQQSEAEKEAIARNALLANPNTTSDMAFSALRGNAGNTRLNALSQQAQNAAVQQAIGNATAAQQADKLGQQALQSGQAAQAKGYTDANNSIQKNQTDTLNKLQDNSIGAKKQLNDYYNNSMTNLNKQEQDYLNQAQNLIKNNNIPPAAIENATRALANSMMTHLKNNNVSPEQKQQMRDQLASVWRIGVGGHPQADMEYSNKLASILTPVAQYLQ